MKALNVTLTIEHKHEGLPRFVCVPIEKNSQARARWERLTPGQKRMLREEILAAKQPATRARRAARALSD